MGISSPGYLRNENYEDDLISGDSGDGGVAHSMSLNTGV